MMGPVLQIITIITRYSLAFQYIMLDTRSVGFTLHLLAEMAVAEWFRRAATESISLSSDAWRAK